MPIVYRQKHDKEAPCLSLPAKVASQFQKQLQHPPKHSTLSHSKYYANLYYANCFRHRNNPTWAYRHTHKRMQRFLSKYAEKLSGNVNIGVLVVYWSEKAETPVSVVYYEIFGTLVSIGITIRLFSLCR